MSEAELIHLAEKAVKKLSEKSKTLALAESCTGGLVSKLITDVSGASAVYMGGVCSYSNSVKTKILGVSLITDVEMMTLFTSNPPYPCDYF